jgi:hypothetical protein
MAPSPDYEEQRSMLPEAPLQCPEAKIISPHVRGSAPSLSPEVPILKTVDDVQKATRFALASRSQVLTEMCCACRSRRVKVFNIKSSLLDESLFLQCGKTHPICERKRLSLKLTVRF